MKVLVTGAGGLAGSVLARHCEEAGHPTTRSGRGARGPQWLVWDMGGPPPALGDGCECVLHTAPIWLLPGHVEALARGGAARIVCYSSTSIETKRDSATGSERDLAALIDGAEKRVMEASDRLRIAATILRPTMIYGYGRDRNVSTIAAFIRRYGFFPVAGAATGRRQPIHVDDLAAATLSVLGNTATYGRTYELAGGEVIGYRAMVQRIFEGLGKRVRILRIPVSLYRGALRVAALTTTGITTSMADRMNKDMIFDCNDARRDFGFNPAGFLDRPERDLAGC